MTTVKKKKKGLYNRKSTAPFKECFCLLAGWKIFPVCPGSPRQECQDRGILSGSMHVCFITTFLLWKGPRLIAVMLSWPCLRHPDCYQTCLIFSQTVFSCKWSNKSIFWWILCLVMCSGCLVLVDPSSFSSGFWKAENSSTSGSTSLSLLFYCIDCNQQFCGGVIMSDCISSLIPLVTTQSLWSKLMIKAW